MGYTWGNHGGCSLTTKYVVIGHTVDGWCLTKQTCEPKQIKHVWGGIMRWWDGIVAKKRSKNDIWWIWTIEVTHRPVKVVASQTRPRYHECVFLCWRMVIVRAQRGCWGWEGWMWIHGSFQIISFCLTRWSLPYPLLGDLGVDVSPEYIARVN